MAYVFNFIRLPPIGTLVEYRGQDFRLVEFQPYQRKDGEPSFVLTWETMCEKSGLVFRQYSGMRTKELNRKHPAYRKARRWPRVNPFK